MVKNRTSIRVRYCETDQMGVVNNANYPTYCEIGRTELFRELGLSYKTIEEAGIILPLVDIYLKFKQPALYDDQLIIETQVNTFPSSRIRFDYLIYNQEGELINEGYSTLAFLDLTTRKPLRLPKLIESILSPYFHKV